MLAAMERSALAIDSAEDVRRCVAGLAEAVEQADEEGTRSDAGRAIRALRQLWRKSPDWFGPEVIRSLRQITERLESRPHGAGNCSHDIGEALRSVFGHASFRPGQREVVEAVLAGSDCIAVMPTGAGKSLTYQMPARLLGGVTLVVSPLIALMKDQVDAMGEIGLRATFLNSSVSPEERATRVAGLETGRYELVYAAPEGIEASVGQVLRRLPLRLIAVDEAHCISEWGHDFRPAYRNLSGLKRRFEGVPMLALTASATPAVTEDIIQQLGMQSPVRYRGSFLRNNLRLHAYRKGQLDGLSVGNAIVSLVRARPGESGIVYCLSRKSTEQTAGMLQRAGVKATHYHAGLPPEERIRAQDAFRDDGVDVVVATIAFGMGIDKPNVRYVIHRDMPRSVEGYYQEVGRAGRDGLPSDCVMFYSWSEVKAYDRFADELGDDAAERTRRQAREMFSLGESDGCRHERVVGWFGEAIGSCGSACDRCLGSDVLEVARRARIAARPRSKGTAPRVLVETTLFERLRELRKALAAERGVPAYVVFSDATLLELAAIRPTSEAELLEISGVGPTKLERYGARFLDLLRSVKD